MIIGESEGSDGFTKGRVVGRGKSDDDILFNSNFKRIIIKIIKELIRD